MRVLPGLRCVTVHDSTGPPIVFPDGPQEDVAPKPSPPDRGHINFWKTECVPASNEGDSDPMDGPPCPLPPPKGGAMFRFFQIAPEKNEAGLTKGKGDKRMARMFEAANAGQARASIGPHTSMHLTCSG